MISIVITSFNEPESIRRAINAILENKIREEYELVIVAPDKETEEIAAEFHKRNKQIKYFKDPGQGKSFALDMAFKVLKGRIWFFSDGDVYLGNDSISEILSFFEDGKVGCVTGRPVATNGRNKMIDYFSNLLLDAGANKMRFEFARKGKFIECTGYLFAVRSGIIKEIPHKDVAEDSIIPYLIWKEGYKISYAPKAKVYVKYPSRLRDFIRQRKRSGVGSHSKLKKYYKDFPKMKSFINEATKGIFWLFKYPNTFKEFIWTLILFPIRLYIWFIYYFEAFIKKKAYGDGWERIESTK